MFRSFLSSIRWTALVLWTYALNGRARQERLPRSVFFDLHQNMYHRYLMILMHFFRISGYSVYVRCRTGFLSNWATHALFRQIPDIRSYGGWTGIPADALVFSDQPMDRPHILLDPDHFRSTEGIYAIPMSMVDTFYLDRTHDRPARDPKEERERGLFFFGNMDPMQYDRPVLGEAFGVMTRHAVISTLRDRLRAHIAEPKDLDEVHVTEDRYVVLMSRQQRYIKPDELRPILERFDFFLAPSGVVMPLCHNLVEAMSVGCIPILQHGHLLSPPLRHLVDCLHFNNPEELSTVVQQLRSMDQSLIHTMRRNVLAYYRDHLTPEAVVGHLERLRGTTSRVTLNAEWPSTQLLLERRRISSGMNS